MTTEEWLEKVDRELGRVKGRNGLLVGALEMGLRALALMMEEAARVPKAEAQGAVGERTVRANKFVLEDERGGMRAVLVVAADMPTLALFDTAGTPRAVLGILAGGPGLTLADENGKSRAVLSVLADGPGLTLFDAAGKTIWRAP